MKQALLEARLLSQSPETIHSRRDESNTVAKEGNTGEHSSKKCHVPFQKNLKAQDT